MVFGGANVQAKHFMTGYDCFFLRSCKCQCQACNYITSAVSQSYTCQLFQPSYVPTMCTYVVCESRFEVGTNARATLPTVTMCCILDPYHHRQLLDDIQLLLSLLIILLLAFSLFTYNKCIANDLLTFLLIFQGFNLLKSHMCCSYRRRF